MMWSTAAPQVPRSRRVSGQRSPVDGDTSRPVISDTGISIAQKLPRLHPIGAYPRLLVKTASRTPAAAILIGAKTAFLLPHVSGPGVTCQVIHGTCGFVTTLSVGVSGPCPLSRCRSNPLEHCMGLSFQDGSPYPFPRRHAASLPAGVALSARSLSKCHQHLGFLSQFAAEHPQPH